MMTTGLARNTDPVESHMAAQAVSATVTQDRLAMLEAFLYLDSCTYRQAAVRAQRTEGSTEVSRLESLRRRGSDLKALEWVSQDGRFMGQATFSITEAGLEALAEGV